MNYFGLQVVVFTPNDNYVEALFIKLKNPYSHFDWFIGGTLRYTFKKK